MRYPEFLKDNGTIGFVAPSFGCNTEPYKTAFEHALKVFGNMGYNVSIGPNCYMGEGIGISNTPQKCAQEINDCYISDESDVLISCGGGELMCEILPYVDFELIKKSRPKWFMGYSDNTNLTYLLTTICDVASIYGPCAAAFGMKPWHQAIGDAFDLLKGKKLCMYGYDGYEGESLKNEENPLAPYNITEKNELKLFMGNENNTYTRIKELQMTGRLIGGCMDSLINLTGTSFDKTAEFLERYKEDGFIWFLEACDLNVISIRRAMWQMEHAGWFKYVKGFMIGRPLVHGEVLMSLNQYDAVLGVIAHYGVPVVMDIDIGHIAPMMPIISGSLSNVTASENRICVDMKQV